MALDDMTYPRGGTIVWYSPGSALVVLDVCVTVWRRVVTYETNKSLIAQMISPMQKS